MLVSSSKSLHGAGPNLALYRSGPTFTRTFQTAYQQYKKQNLAPFSALRSWDGETLNYVFHFFLKPLIIPMIDEPILRSGICTAHELESSDLTLHALFHRLILSSTRLLFQESSVSRSYCCGTNAFSWMDKTRLWAALPRRMHTDLTNITPRDCCIVLSLFSYLTPMTDCSCSRERLARWALEALCRQGVSLSASHVVIFLVLERGLLA
jgi:hypothetical protein